ncbi:MAG: nickel transporter, partial [Actinomycetota bacterium]|nr:nickel transporter [Actinomycetota bacterium]
MRRLVALLPVAFAATLLGGTPASAHPLGNFTTNAGAAITILPGTVRVDYALDIAEIPTFQLSEEINSDQDPDIDGSELAWWARRRAEELAGALEITVDDHPVALELGASRAAFAPGQGGLPVLRLDARLEAPIPPRGELRFADGSELGAAGWREVTATGSDGMAVTGSTVPA